MCWLTSDRPFPDDDCDGVDDFKYGLASNFPAYATANAHALERDGIIERYNGRTISYAWGLVGDLISHGGLSTKNIICRKTTATAILDVKQK